MKQSYIFLADGFEEVEALTVIDIMRRAGMNVKSVSINDTPQVTGAHGVAVAVDSLYTEVLNFNDADWLIVPGGMPGSSNLAQFAPLCELLKAHNADGGNIAGICAAPSLVLAPLGILNKKKATCYPGMEENCRKNGAKMVDEYVVASDNVITGQGPAAAMPFALAIVEKSCGEAVANKVGTGLLYYK